MDEVKKILILGDALSLPRPDDGVMVENTFEFLLSQTHGVFVSNRSIA